MLPELLFNVGNSMQDFSKEDYNCILNSSCDKDSNFASTETTLERIKLTKTPDLIEGPESIKLEDSSIYSWHSTTADIGSNLLRSSDDPLISGGTDNQNDNEFPVNRKSPALIVSPASPSISIIEPKPHKRNRIRKKAQFKLRFHHQALPPEYLDHYEASQHNVPRSEQLQISSSSLQATISGKKKTNQAAHNVTDTRQKATNDSVKSWLQKIAEAQHQDVLQKVEQSIGEPETPINQKTTKMINYKDLPYMGEMTLENSKPRRGRKPKKADICHLIYKNYGYQVPGAQERAMETSDAHSTEKDSNILKKHQSEPLNLCVRDNGDTFILSSSDEEESIDSGQATPLLSPNDIAVDSNLATSLKMSLPNFNSKQNDQPSTSDTASNILGDSDKQSEKSGSTNWAKSGVFVHPMALYYQKMMGTNAGNVSTEQDTGNKFNSEPYKQELHQKLIPRNISKLLKEEKLQPTSSTSSETSSPNSSRRTTPTPQKRKRSAIFIPPVPVETKSHATEVSICKFKFTGGAKPSLQEKKMLSVDAGGNFRYYSGTGDKSMRGYEFFPRESLALSSLTANTTTNAFLNATSEKIDLPPPSQGLSNEILQIPEFPSTSAVAPLPSPIKHHRYHHGSLDKRKRKSKRSLQREKLEKTFKEKGFLIQTQQLQSAEGATYCKFRQLRKFTRYLFRSWKDYLPGDVQGQLVDANGAPLHLQNLPDAEIPITNSK